MVHELHNTAPSVEGRSLEMHESFYGGIVVWSHYAAIAADLFAAVARA